MAPSTMAMPTEIPRAQPDSQATGEASRQLYERLLGGGREREAAVVELHALLLKATRFTTWVYKFGLLEAGVKVRRRAWQGREIPIEDEAWATLADAGTAVANRVESRELIGALRGGADADAAVPGMRAHLQGCPACEEDHRSLAALLDSEA